MVKPDFKNIRNEYDKMKGKADNLFADTMFDVKDNIKSSYSMFGHIFQEISNLRQEVSRLGVMVRVNSSTSPNVLEAYHAHILSLLIPCSTIIPDEIWKKIELLWMNAGYDIDEYFKQRRIIQNKKIPAELIRKLDKLYRAALLAAQSAGLGIQTENILDINKQIENAIVGN